MHIDVHRAHRDVVAEHDAGMLLQLAADAGQIGNALDPMTSQLAGWSQTRQHQDLRRADRPSREQNVSICARDFSDAEMFEIHGFGGALAHSNSGYERAFQHRQIFVAEDGPQISTRSATTQAAPLRGLIKTNAFLRNAIEVFVRWNSCRDTSVDEQAIERMANAQIRDAEQALIGVVLTGAILIALGADRKSVV